jgi:hypothetical protein
MRFATSPRIDLLSNRENTIALTNPCASNTPSVTKRDVRSATRLEKCQTQSILRELPVWRDTDDTFVKRARHKGSRAKKFAAVDHMLFTRLVISGAAS